MAKLVLKIEKPLNGYSKVINKLKIDEYQFDSLISLAIPLNGEKKCRLNFKRSLREPKWTTKWILEIPPRRPNEPFERRVAIKFDCRWGPRDVDGPVT